ncbi:MAG: trans-sulfuration enzyme family protein [Gemmatimonadota bacterium]
MRPETLAVHAGQRVDPATGALTSPIHLSTTFERAPDGSFPHGYIYARDANPNRNQLEECLALLEGGAGCIAFASGSAATAAIFQALEPGAHVIAPYDAYYGTNRLLREHFARWRLEHTLVDTTSVVALRAAVTPATRLVWIETPSNPLIRITDIRGAGEVARAAGARLVCDNTWCTPLLQRPLELGADLVVHATTKYLGGHSDVMGGAVIARASDAFFERVRALQKDAGAIPAPFDCWLILRGVRTLPDRMRAHCENAVAVASFLTTHDAVAAVHYPGLRNDPGYAVAKAQMSAFGGMLSFEVRGGRAEALRVAAAVRLFTRATSLGGPESLIEHRASVEGPATRAPESLLRCSVGLEHADDLIADLRAALEAIR